MNRVCEILGIKYPVIQAPMAWITSAEMVAAVSNAGGFGIIGTNAGQTEAEADPQKVYEHTCEQIRKVQELTDKPFGVNYMLPVPGMEDDPSANAFSDYTLKAIIDCNAPVIVAVGACSEKAFAKITGLGKKIIYRELDPSVEGAVLAEKLGADIVVATGFDEGGGMPGKEIGTMSIVPIIADAVKVPVLAAGGIVDHRQFNAALALGAEGVFCGTVFIASEECPAAQVAKDDIVNTTSFDLLTYRALPSFWRTTPHGLSKELKEGSDTGVDLVTQYTKMGGTISLRTGQLLGDLDGGINSVNSSISLIKCVRSCKEIVEDLVQDFKA